MGARAWIDTLFSRAYGMVLPNGTTPFSVEQHDLPATGDKPSIPITLHAIMDHVTPLANGSAEGKSVI